MILPVVLVTIQGAQPNIPRDIAAADEVLFSDCGLFVDVLEEIVVNRPDLLFLTQEDCRAAGHVVSNEEDELFSLGRGRGADLVGYYIQDATSGALGCAAHPPGRRGFWVADDGAAFDWVWIHEAGHVIGDNAHIIDTDNVMHPFANELTNLPPDFNDDQCRRILNDPALLCVPSVVLNL